MVLAPRKKEKKEAEPDLARCSLFREIQHQVNPTTRKHPLLAPCWCVFVVPASKSWTGQNMWTEIYLSRKLFVGRRKTKSLATKSCNVTWPQRTQFCSPFHVPYKKHKAKAMTMRAVLRVAVLAAAASCVLAEKGDLYGKDGKEKGSVVEVLTRTLGQMRGMLWAQSFALQAHAEQPAAAPALAMKRAQRLPRVSLTVCMDVSCALPSRPCPRAPSFFAILRANFAFLQLTIVRAWPGAGRVGMVTRCEGH